MTEKEMQIIIISLSICVLLGPHFYGWINVEYFGYINKEFNSNKVLFTWNGIAFHCFFFIPWFLQDYLRDTDKMCIWNHAICEALSKAGNVQRKYVI